MVELEAPVYDFALKILSNFDPKRARETKLTELAGNLAEAQAVEEKQKVANDLSIQANSDKWDNFVKKVDIEEKIEEAKDEDYERKSKEYMEKIMGCSKNHSKEIDLYEKTFAEKVERVQTMMYQGSLAYDTAMEQESLDQEPEIPADPTERDEESKEEVKSKRDEELQKASYYFQQAELVFYYLIPDTEEETVETDMLKLNVNFGMAKVQHAQRKYLEALQQVDQSKADLKHAHMDKMPEAPKVLTELQWLKARTLLDLERYNDAEQACSEIVRTEENGDKIDKFQAEVDEAKRVHAEQEKLLYKKMLKSKKKDQTKTEANTEIQVEVPIESVEE